MPETVGTPLMWAGFTVIILALLAVDLFLFHRKPHAIRQGEALGWTIVWVSLAMLFNAGVYHFYGPVRGLEFFTGYLVEEALSVDNLLVFILIFQTFGVPPSCQHRVLFFGILGALVMRAAFILAGTALITTFHWVIYLFGAFLVFTGGKILVGHGTEVHPEQNPVLKLFGKAIPTIHEFRDGRFTVRVGGKRYATALLPVLLVVEMTDLVFAVDSIPAIFGVTRDPFIVYTSNIFAILGLRSLYFLLSSAMEGFRFLKHGLGLVLAFIGAKMLLSGWFDVTITVSLAAVVSLLGASVLASLLFPHGRGEKPKRRAGGKMGRGEGEGERGETGE